MRGPRDRIYGRYLVRENPWLQLQGRCVLLTVRYAPIATKFRSAAKRRDVRHSHRRLLGPM